MFKVLPNTVPPLPSPQLQRRMDLALLVETLQSEQLFTKPLGFEVNTMLPQRGQDRHLRSTKRQCEGDLPSTTRRALEAPHVVRDARIQIDRRGRPALATVTAAPAQRRRVGLVSDPAAATREAAARDQPRSRRTRSSADGRRRGQGGKEGGCYEDVGGFDVQHCGPSDWQWVGSLNCGSRASMALAKTRLSTAGAFDGHLYASHVTSSHDLTYSTLT